MYNFRLIWPHFGFIFMSLVNFEFDQNGNFLPKWDQCDIESPHVNILGITKKKTYTPDLAQISQIMSGFILNIFWRDSIENVLIYKVKFMNLILDVYEVTESLRK